MSSCADKVRELCFGDVCYRVRFFSRLACQIIFLIWFSCYFSLILTLLVFCGHLLIFILSLHHSLLLLQQPQPSPTLSLPILAPFAPVIWSLNSLHEHTILVVFIFLRSLVVEIWNWSNGQFWICASMTLFVFLRVFWMSPIRTLLFIILSMSFTQNCCFYLVVLLGLNQFGGTPHRIHVLTMVSLIIIQWSFLNSCLWASIL